MRRLLLMLALLFYPAFSSAQGSATCVSGSLSGFTGVLCALGITFDSNNVTNPSGNETKTYDVYWPTALGVNNNNRNVVYVHGGGFAGKLQYAGDYPSAEFIDKFVNPTSAAPSNFYVVTYTVAQMLQLTSSLSIGGTSMAVTTEIGCQTSYWWPTSGTPFPITVDVGANQESFSVINLAGNCSSATWTLGSSATKNHTLTNRTLTSVAPYGDGYQAVYQGAITGGGSNALAGQIVDITGFQNTSGSGPNCGYIDPDSPNGACNNGKFLVTASTATSLTVDNPSAVAETHAGNAKNSIYGWMSNIQPPVPMRDLAAFLSYLAHCSAGGTSHNSGTCTAVTGSANTPGNPHQIVLVGSSAGGMYTQLLLQSGCVNGSMCPFLDNNITDLGKGYTPWSDTGWNIANPYGTTYIGFSDAIDATSIFARDTKKGRLQTLGGFYPPALCGCIPTCDNGNPASFDIPSMTCKANPNSCYTTCETTLAPYYMASQLSKPSPVPSWMCDGVGVGGVCNANGAVTIGSGPDPDFTEIDCLMGTTPNWTIYSAQAGHGCGAVAEAIGSGLATSGSINGSTVLTVTAPVLVSIAVTPVSPSLAAGKQQQLTATGTYSDGSHQDLTSSATWTSSAPAVATINSAGLATAAAVGSTTIQATSGSVNGSTDLTVTAPLLVSIAVTPPNSSIAAGNQQQFTATGTYSDGSHQDLTSSATWTSSAHAVATINSAGLATAAAVGGTTIQATSGSVNGSTDLTVTPEAQVSLAWTDSTSQDVAGYNAYRSTISGGPYTKLNSSLITTTSYTDQGLNSENTYYYVTTAVNSQGLESAYSNEAVANWPQ